MFFKYVIYLIFGALSGIFVSLLVGISLVCHLNFTTGLNTAGLSLAVFLVAAGAIERSAELRQQEFKNFRVMQAVLLSTAGFLVTFWGVANPLMSRGKSISSNSDVAIFVCFFLSGAIGGALFSFSLWSLTGKFRKKLFALMMIGGGLSLWLSLAAGHSRAMENSEGPVLMMFRIFCPILVPWQALAGLITGLWLDSVRLSRNMEAR